MSAFRIKPGRSRDRKDEPSESDTGTGTRGLVHLAEHESALRVVVLELDDTSLDHLVVQVWTGRARQFALRQLAGQKFEGGDSPLPSRVRSPTPVKTE